MVYFSSLINQKNLSGQSADIVLTNVKIFTYDTKKLYVPAIAIKGNRILATGSKAAIQKLASSKQSKLICKVKRLCRRFNNQHDHAVFQQSPDLRTREVAIIIETGKSCLALKKCSPLSECLVLNSTSIYKNYPKTRIGNRM